MFSPIAQVGEKIKKKSNKPFKSGDKEATVIGYMTHPITYRIAYVIEDGTHVEIKQCEKV